MRPDRKNFVASRRYAKGHGPLISEPARTRPRVCDGPSYMMAPKDPYRRCERCNESKHMREFTTHNQSRFGTGYWPNCFDCRKGGRRKQSS